MYYLCYIETIMRKDAVLAHQSVYFRAGAIAAHAHLYQEGFRQKDLRFYIELFSNWMETTLEGPSLEIHNVQISRFLEGLVKEGFCRKGMQKGNPSYRLTRAGIIGLFGDLVNREHFLPLEQFFFLHFIVESYGQVISDLVEKEGLDFPKALKFELDYLRDPKQLVARQLKFVDKEIAKLELRVKDACDASALARSLFDKEVKTGEIIEEVQKRFPYELNNLKPFKDLLRQVPSSLRRWELVEGAEKRGLALWKPMLEFLVAYRRQVALLDK